MGGWSRPCSGATCTSAAAPASRAPTGSWSATRRRSKFSSRGDGGDRDRRGRDVRGPQVRRIGRALSLEHVRRVDQPGNQVGGPRRQNDDGGAVAQERGGERGEAEHALDERQGVPPLQRQPERAVESTRAAVVGAEERQERGPE